MSFPEKPKSKLSLKSIIGTIAVGGMAITPFLSGMGKDVNNAYKNDAGKPTICFGHTKNVKMGDVASDEQCRKHLESDLTESMAFVIKQTPDILQYKNPLQAATHYTLSEGQESYLSSPMLAKFKEKKWVEGCHAFLGYNTRLRYKFRKFGYDCIKLEDNTWSCIFPDSVAVRKLESKLCLSKN